MPRKPYSPIPIQFRPYSFPSLFPVISFFGKNWNVTMKEPEFLHFHNCVELGHCISGSGTICFRDYQLSYSAGDYSVISPLEPHMSVCSDAPSQWEYIFFDPTILFGTSNERITRLYQSYYLFEKPSRIISRDGSSLFSMLEQLFSMLEQLFPELQQKEILYPNAMHSLLLMILIELNRLPSRAVNPVTDAAISPIRTALLHMYAHYMEPITVTELAEKCCLSESHFRRVFKQMIGLSPQEYLQHYRIQHACHRMLKYTEPLNQIASSVGFPSISSFNRQFTQYTGMSPSEWKKQFLSPPISHNITSLEDETSQHIFQY
ncbi:MAG: AraC family transcriptional regulator [Lachnospiraceae bacterium]|nr:AraC family transcriptional regulator [Lachnospiraceae bacterium]